MICRKGICVITCFLMLITVASALLPDLPIISTSVDWPVANTVDTTIITVHVTNISTGSDVSAVLVTFFSDNIVYGNVSPSETSTNGLGIATTTFTVNKTSGTVPIHAVVSYIVAGLPVPNQVIYQQKIDHGPAYSASLDYKSEVIVDQTTPFIVTLKDFYGNRVDNKNPAKVHTMKFNIYFPPGGLGTGGLKNATSDYATTFSDTTDIQGNISLTAKVDTVPGQNNIYIAPIEYMPDPLYPYIMGITQATPFFIEQVFYPTGNPPALPADGSSEFDIVYTLTDKFRNPAGHQTVSITSDNKSLGNFTTNDWGQVAGLKYGRTSTTGFFNVTAVALANTSVWCSQTVQFYDTDPISMVVTANPQMMPSRDVPANPPVTAKITAKIMDIMGNGVDGESVTFTLTGYTNSTVLVTRPSFSTGSYSTTTNAITDSNGNAIVDLYAGEFPTSGPNYNSTATGTATVFATWKGKSMPITVTFKNYPYLRVEVATTPSTVNVSSFFDVDIRLIGDGWKLQGKQIDAVLVTDRSSSMLMDNPDRMVSVMNASKTFVDAMNVNAFQDHVGLVTFGSNGVARLTPYWNGWSWDWNDVDYYWAWVYRDDDNDYSGSYSTTSNHAKYVAANYTGNPRNYGAYAVLEQGLSSCKTSVYTAIGNMVPSGGTPMRYGIYTGINEIKNNGRAGVTRGLIVLSDGDYNYYGDPLARGVANNHGSDVTNYGDLDTDYITFTGLGTGQFSNQNMSVYANANSIKIYSIGYAANISAGGKNTLRILAEATGGKYFDGSSSNIADIYKTIAGDLKEMAGVNTQMNLSFQNVNVTYNNVTTQVPGQEVFDYTYLIGVSTWVTSWNATMTPLPDQVPKPPYPDVLPNFGSYTTYPYSFNQRDEWLSTSSLKFNAGNISINQTWETKFRFRVDKPGNIQIFGPGSKIVFNNGEQTLDLPATYISAVLNLTSSGLNATTLDIFNLHSTASGVITDSIPLEWHIAYGGNQTVTERISYSNDGGNTWVLFDTNYVDKSVTIDHSSLDVRMLPPGEYYIRVDATAPDAPSDRETIMAPGIPVGTGGRAYIKLE